MNGQKKCCYEFEAFRVDPLKRQLTLEGETVPLASKTFEALVFLLLHRGETVTKDELMDHLWTDVSVEENNLTQQISTLRKVLGERRRDPRFIITVPGQGYSFIAPVKEICEAENVLPETAGAHAGESARALNGAATTANAFSHRINDVPRPAFLRSKTVYLSIAALAALSLIWLFAMNREAIFGTHAKSVAVLPFKQLNADGNNNFLGAGMSDTLIAKLGNVQNLTVRPTSAITKYAGDGVDALTAGRELKTDAVLEGTIQQSGERVRVTVQMTDVATGKIIWGQSFDEKFSDIFALQDMISSDVAQILKVKLSPTEQQTIRRHSTENLEAYEAYLRGRFFWNRRDLASVEKGIEYFNEAIRRDPNYASALSGLADSYLILNYYFQNKTTPEENLQKARQAAQKALEIDETLAEAHATLGFLYFFGERSAANAGTSEKEFRRAIELNPNYPTAHHWYSDFLAVNSRPQEAMREIKIAVNLDPLSPIINTTYGERLFYERRYDEAVEQLRRTVEIDERFATAHYLLALALEQKGALSEALAAIEKAQSLTRLQDFEAARAHILAVSGRKAEAEKILTEMIGRSAEPHAVAIVYAGLGDERALEWLMKLDKSKARWFMLSDPRLDPLRSKPEFQRLLEA